RLPAQEHHGANDIASNKRERHRQAEKQKHGGAAKQQQCSHLPRQAHCARSCQAIPICYEAETASARGPIGELASRCIRKTNSMATSKKATGRLASIHHSGRTRVFRLTAPAA